MIYVASNVPFKHKARVCASVCIQALFFSSPKVPCVAGLQNFLWSGEEELNEN